FFWSRSCLERLDSVMQVGGKRCSGCRRIREAGRGRLLGALIPVVFCIRQLCFLTRWCWLLAEMIPTSTLPRPRNCTILRAEVGQPLVALTPRVTSIRRRCCLTERSLS